MSVGLSVSVCLSVCQLFVCCLSHTHTQSIFTRKESMCQRRRTRTTRPMVAQIPNFLEFTCLLDGFRNTTRRSSGISIICSEIGQRLPKKWVEKDLPRSFSPVWMGFSIVRKGKNSNFEKNSSIGSLIIDFQKPHEVWKELFEQRPR